MTRTLCTFALALLAACANDGHGSYVPPLTNGPITPAQGPSVDMSRPTTQHTTVRDRCERLWTAVCDQWIACGVVTGEAATDCVAITLDRCCAGTACVAPDTQNAAAVDLCEEDVSTASCAVIVYDAQNQTLPSSCQGLLF